MLRRKMMQNKETKKCRELKLGVLAIVKEVT